MLEKRILLVSLLVYCLFLPPVAVAESQLSVMHYFADELGQLEIEKILAQFEKEHGISIVDKPVGHEDFKNTILQMAAEGRMPDVASYWAGARTQFLVDSAALAPLPALWKRGQFNRLIPESLASASTRYNDERYLIPFGYHAVGFFYNPQVLSRIGVTATPQNWDEFLHLCGQLKAAGIKPLALGAKNRWPAQFWFDYLLLQTAGPDFRQQLMVGKGSYRDPLVLTAVQLWRNLLGKGYFSRGMLTDDWTDAADMVASGKAAMTLMGSWVTGYWKNQSLLPGTEFDFFPFPQIDPAQPKTVVGPVDGLVIGANSKNRQQAEALIEYLLTDLQVQGQWAKAQGALSPNLQLSASTYDPVMKKVQQLVKQADHFVFNYDLSTSPPVAELGLSLFVRLLQDPGDFSEELTEMAEMAESLFSSKGSTPGGR